MIAAALFCIFGVFQFVFVILSWEIPLVSESGLTANYLVLFTFVYILSLFLYVLRHVINKSNPGS